MIEQKLTAVDAAVDKRVRRLNERNEKRKSTPIRAGRSPLNRLRPAPFPRSSVFAFVPYLYVSISRL